MPEDEATVVTWNEKQVIIRFNLKGIGVGMLSLLKEEPGIANKEAVERIIKLATSSLKDNLDKKENTDVT
jgi:hypothetical protein